MQSLARSLLSLLAAAIFAAASVMWAPAGLPTDPVASEHGDHVHQTSTACIASAGDDCASEHSESADTCCTFACHAVAELTSNQFAELRIDQQSFHPTAPRSLFAASENGLERPPRAA
jgi:hypothetical protein